MRSSSGYNASPSADNLPGAFFTQHTGLLGLGAPIAPLLPAEEGEHAAIGALPLD